MTTQHWKTDIDDNGIAWLCLDTADAKVNVLSSEILYELSEILDPMTASPPAGLVLWSGKNRSFVMGADIKEFTKVESVEHAEEVVQLGQQLMDKVEDLRCPTVAVINGICLGGGLELVMACDYRIVFAGLSETDDADIRAALAEMYRRYQKFIVGRVRDHRANGNGADFPDASLVGWAVIGLGTVASITRELGLVSDRQRRRLLAEVGRELLAGRDG